MTPRRLANPRAVRFPRGALTISRLVGQAWYPSYRAPRASDVLDPGAASPPELPRMSAQERRLLDAVLLDPEADEPRRAYAEWVRHQEQPPTEHSAFAAFGARDLVIRRGFVEGMSLAGRAFISLGDTITRLTPLRELKLVAVQPFVDELARCPHLAGLRRLDLTGNYIGPAGMRELAGSPFLGGLRELVLTGNGLTAAGAAELAKAPWLANLTSLEIADNGLTSDDLAAILVGCPNLESLSVSGNRLGSAGLLVCPRFRRLAAARCGLGPADADAIFCGKLLALEALDLSLNGLGADGAVALSEDGSLANLARLDLGFNDIESPGAEALSLADALASLVSLNLAGNRITQSGARALAASDVFGSITDLDLTANPLGDQGAAAILRGEAFASVTRLVLENCDITDDGALSLVATGAMGGLTELSLAWNRIGNAGVKVLACCPDLAALRELDLTGTPIGYAGAVAIAESTDLRSLRRVVLGENHRLPADAVAMLAERFGTMTPDTLHGVERSTSERHPRISTPDS